MKTLLKNLVVIGTVVAAGGTNADILDTFNAYAGADVTQARSKGRNDWAQVLPRDFIGGSLYVGTRFHEFFSLEAGYDGTRTQKKDWTMVSGNAFFGGQIPAGQTLSGTTKVKKSGGHLDLNGYLPVSEYASLIATVGIGWVQAKVESSFNILPGTMTTASALSSVSGKGRAVARAGVGAHYMVTEDVGVRAKISWDSTTTLRFKGNALFSSLGYDQKPYKGTTTFSLGAFVKF